jgi:hypothetical protein
MRGNLTSIVVFAIAALMVSGPVFAHHGGDATYDMAKTVTVKGTVTDFRFSNPHVLIFIEVKNQNGEVQKWLGELTSPNHLARAGWTINSIKIGDEITLAGSPMKSGAPSIWVRRVLSPTGEEMKTGGG